MLQRVLVLADEVPVRRRLQRLLPSTDAVVETAAPESLWSRLGQGAYDAVVAADDAIPSPPSQSVAALQALPEAPRLVVVLREDDAEVRAAFQAAGAFSVVDGELDDDALRAALSAVFDQTAALLQQEAELERERDDYSLSDFSSSSTSMQRVLDLARKVASGDTSAMILGETGVGKEWLARSIHAAGARAQAPFVAVNCAAIPDSMLESELFGHEQGAFTGAHRAHRGYFEQAHGGTLFLDEIGEMPAPLQTRLLRVLQDRRVQRLGAETSFEVDVRVMTATNRDVHAAIEDGTLRQDLFYRLAVVMLEVPPLRSRREDIAPLFRSHVEANRVRMARWELTGVSDEAIAAVEAYSWPGNVRELINVAERAVLLAEGAEIDVDDLPPPMGAPGDSVDARTWLRDELFAQPLEPARESLLESFEREYIERLLQREAGHLGRTAERAGINPRTLYNKMKRFGLHKSAYRRQGRTGR